MKVSLVVASGAHEGKVIPITGPQFLIGRDAQCNLRPASQAISKQHCGVLVRDGQIYIKDYGSTNGTLVNDVLIRATEVPAVDGTSLKLGPLDFIVRIEVSAPNPDGTPLPGHTPESVAALAAVKAATGMAAASKAPVRDTTPNPALPKKPAPAGSKEAGLTGSKEAKALSGSKEGAALSGSKEAAALKAAAAKVPTKPAQETSHSTLSAQSADEDDKMAAMLLDMEDDQVPEGSTVVEMPAVDAQGNPLPQAQPKEEAKKPAQAQTREEMSSAASDLLRKMMRRPK